MRHHNSNLILEKMKRLVLIFLVLILLLSGCGQSSSQKAEAANEYQVAQDFKNSLIENYPSEENGLLWSTDDFIVNVNSDECTVAITIRAGADEYIPDLAEVIIPLVRQALDDYSLKLDRLTINSYDSDSSDGTLVDWHTYDLEEGYFTSEKDGNYIAPQATIDDVRNFFENRVTESLTDDESAVDPDANRTVYVTATGDKYHYSSTCNGGTYTATTLEKAKSRGLTACGKCVK